MIKPDQKFKRAFQLITGLILLLFFLQDSYGQDSTAASSIQITDTVRQVFRHIEGTIKTKDGQGLPGVTVNIQGKPTSTVTDSYGNFRIPADSLEKIIFSYGGFENISLPAMNNNVERSGFNFITRWVIEKSPNISIETKSIQVFPIPYPSASASYPLKLNTFSNIHLLKDVDQLLINALDHCGYDERKYYGVPGGFALVTQMEQTDKNGISLNASIRWRSEITSELNSPWQYIKALFNAPEGYFRVIVFIVGPQDLNSSGRDTTAEQFKAWLKTGNLTLNSEVGSLPLSSSDIIQFLVYQYHKDVGSAPVYVQSSAISGKMHFIKSQLSKFIH